MLPFDNLSGDDADGRLAGGLTEDIITDLARFREFDVIARNSTAVYEGQPVDIRQVGEHLGVSYVLEGSVQRDDDDIRITAQFLDAETGAHLWSERWDRPAEDVFAVQTEIAEQVAGRLGGFHGVVSEAEMVARRARPKDLIAYELYLEGQEVMFSDPPESLYEAIRLYEQAVDIDPTFARAWVALAGVRDGTAAFGADPAEALSSAIEAAERAVQLDPMDADAHAMLANALQASGDRARAEAELDAALRLNPGSTHILAMCATLASGFGEPMRGAECADRAIRLDPNYRGARTTRFKTGYFWAGRYEDALRMIESQPADRWSGGSLVMRAASYAALDRLDEAEAAVADALARRPRMTIQGFLSGPSWTETERRLMLELMREASFPPCAASEDLAKLEEPLDLPECAPAPATATDAEAAAGR